MLKRLLVTIILAGVLSIAFTIPAFADQPDNPGAFGEQVVEGAQDEYGPGLSYEVFNDAKAMADFYGVPMGYIVNMLLESEGGIPPKHTP